MFDIYHLLFALNMTSFVRPRPGAIHGEVMVMGEEGEGGGEFSLGKRLGSPSFDGTAPRGTPRTRPGRRPVGSCF